MKFAYLISAVAMMAATPAMSQDVGPIKDTFKATYVATSGAGCSGLLITGQFVAPTPGYNISLSFASEQPNAPRTYDMDMKSAPPSGNQIQVLALTPVIYEDANFNECPYGITITYVDDTFVIPFSPS